MTSIKMLPTGVPHLDTLLGGGLTPHALTMLVGQPGAGKTVLTSQIAFALAGQDMPVLILTTYSEGHSKYLEHLQSFGFFEQAMIDKRVHLYTLSSLLTDDPTTTLRNLTALIKQVGAKVLFIDGLQTLSSTALSSSVRTMLANLSIQSIYLDVTALITLTGAPRSEILYQEMTIADTVLGLRYELEQQEHVRYIEVIKQRGRAQLAGLHPYEITAAGVMVYPRLEVTALPEEAPHRDGRAPFGLPELDVLLGEGLTLRTTTTLAGAPGTGKTVLALCWALHEATPSDASLFVSFSEYPAQLLQKATVFGIPLETLQASGAVRLLHSNDTPVNPDRFAVHLLEVLADPTIRRLVVDDTGMLVRVLGHRGPDYLLALRKQLYQRGITSLFTLEISPLRGLQLDLANLPIGFVAENLIITQQFVVGDVLRRLIAVLRMRFSGHDRTLRELILEPDAIRILRAVDSAADVLDEAARTGGGAAPAS